jgi:Ca-activated chloride channel family protein
LDFHSLKKKHIEKYILSGILVSLIVLACALPQAVNSSFVTQAKTGDIIFLVDVSGSMAAREDIDSSSRLERAKEIMYDVIDEMELLGDVKIGLCAFTNIATSLVPIIGAEDYSYLKESIDKVLDVTSVPGTDTRIGQSILDVIGLPSLENTNKSYNEEPKIIILISDGDIFYLETPGVGTAETVAINNAISTSLEENIKIITIGVGDPDGEKIPIYDENGIFTNNYEQISGFDVVSYLEEEVLMEIALKTNGEYFYEDDLSGLTGFIEANLGTASSSTQVEDNYNSIALWFLLVAIPFWIVLAKRHVLG